MLLQYGSLQKGQRQQLFGGFLVPPKSCCCLHLNEKVNPSHAPYPTSTVQAHLGYAVGSVPDHCNKADIAIKGVVIFAGGGLCLRSVKIQYLQSIINQAISGLWASR